MHEVAKDLEISYARIYELCMKHDIGVRIGDRWFLNKQHIAKLRERPWNQENKE